MSERKSIDDYEYEVKIHDVEGDNVTLLFSEVDGNDGFGVTVHRDELQRMLNDGTFDDWARERVEERIAVLKRAEEERKARDELRKKLSKLEDMLKRKKFKPKKKEVRT